MLSLSVVVITHQPVAEHLRRTLEALRLQTLPLDQWELLVVDNGSAPALSLESLNLFWHPSARVIREDELGASLARQRGIAAAAAELIVFVDDDNVLAPNYLAAAIEIAAEWPRLGVWGGSIVPEFEAEPAAHLREFLNFLALREITAERWSNLPNCWDASPWGAGMCVRASVAAAYCETYAASKVRLTDRRGKTDLISGGDTEISYVACRMGFGMGLFPQLRITHLIPPARLEEDYLVRICEGVTASCHLIEYKWHRQALISPLAGLGLLRIAKNLLAMRGVHRRMYLARQRGLARARRMIKAAL